MGARPLHALRGAERCLRGRGARHRRGAWSASGASCRRSSAADPEASTLRPSSSPSATRARSRRSGLSTAAGSQDVEGYFQAGSDRDYIAASLGSDPPGCARDPLPRVRPRPSEPHPERAAAVAVGGAGRGVLALGGRRGGSARRASRLPTTCAASSARSSCRSRAYCGGLHVAAVQRGRPARDLLLAVVGPRPLGCSSAAGRRGRPTSRCSSPPSPTGVEPARAFTSAFGADVATAEGLLAAYVAAPLPVGRFVIEGLDSAVTVEMRGPAPRPRWSSASATFFCTQGGLRRRGATSSAPSRATRASVPLTRRSATWPCARADGRRRGARSLSLSPPIPRTRWRSSLRGAARPGDLRARRGALAGARGGGGGDARAGGRSSSP